MRNYKRIIFLLITSILILAGCGERSKQNPNESTTDITGIVTSIEGNRILIVDKESDISDNTMPMAIWVRFDQDQDQAEKVKIGYRVKAWINGEIMESYPMQTTGVKLEVINSAIGEGDMQGIITRLYLDDSENSKSYIEVNGKRLSLIPSTDYMLGDAITDSSQMKVGDQVELWFPGYQIMDEQVVTQVRIVR